MAEPFGRGSRSSSIRSQSAGSSSCTSNKKRLGSSKLERVVKRPPPPIKEKCSPLKAGTDKAQGSESGSSKESPPSSPTSKHSPKFKTCRRRRRRRRRTRSPITQTASLSSSTSTALSCPPSVSPKHTVTTRPTSAPTKPKPTFLSKTRRTTAAAAASSTTIQEKILPSIFFIFNFPRAKPRICEKNGREPPPSSNIVKIGDKKHSGRDCGGPRRPHCSVHRKKRPPQQGLHCQRSQRPPRPALSSYCHSVLRCAGPPRLRPSQQSRRLAHQESQGFNRRACRATRMGSNHCGLHPHN